MVRNRNPSLSGAKIRRFAVEVGGYSWLVHGGMREGRFEAHLVELRGMIRLDVPVDARLTTKMSKAIAKHLRCAVKPIRADLFLIE
jgi:hypothetical protein